MSMVIVRSTKDRPLTQVVRAVMDALRWREIVAPGARVVAKLNLNTPEIGKLESANTSPDLAASLCEVLLERTRNVTLVESHSYRYPAELAFENTGIYRVARQLGVSVVNLSTERCRDVGNTLLGPMPEILLDADVFVTLPVIKTHALTYFTGAIKNQWGCVPRYDRIALHYALDQLLVDLNALLKPRLCIMDGLVGVDGRGPTNGKPRRLDLVLGSRDAVALDATAMRLVGLDPRKCRHLVMAHQAGQGDFEESMIALDIDVERGWQPFEEAKLDWAVDWMNRLTRHRFFRERILGVNAIFYPTKALVGMLRKVGIVR
jgi:uncharacterized protein (DUF362 family)